MATKDKSTFFLGVKLTAQEKDELQRITAEEGATISETARRLMFRNSPDANRTDLHKINRKSVISDASESQKMILTFAASMKKSFTETAQKFKFISEKISEKDLSLQSVRSYLSDLQFSIVDLQKLLNKYLKAAGDPKEIHLLTMPVTASEFNSPDEEFRCESFVSVSGFVSREGKMFFTRNGDQKYSAYVTCKKTSGEKTWYNLYEIVDDYDETTCRKLEKDALVNVSGELDFSVASYDGKTYAKAIITHPKIVTLGKQQ